MENYNIFLIDDDWKNFLFSLFTIRFFLSVKGSLTFPRQIVNLLSFIIIKSVEIANLKHPNHHATICLHLTIHSPVMRFCECMGRGSE